MNRDILFRIYDTESKRYLTGDYSIGVESGEIRGIYGEKFPTLIAEQLHNALTRKVGRNVFVGDIIKYDLESGLGQPKRIGLTETVRSVEFDYHYYANIRVVGTIHDTHLTKQS